MIYKEITMEEYEKLDCLTDKECFTILKKEHSELVKKTLESLSDFTRDMDIMEGYEPHNYSDDQLIEIFGEDRIIEYATEWTDDEFITNYFVTDSVGTDRGTWNMIVASGYKMEVEV